MDKYKIQSVHPTFGNLAEHEYISEESKYQLSHCLNDNTPEERYKQRKRKVLYSPFLYRNGETRS